MNAAEIRKMSDDQLVETAQQIRKELFGFRNQAVTQKLENPGTLGDLRKDVARLLTEKRSRELAALSANSESN
ncbi:MAG: 50S ribosomal protein L29 [Algisphaera sp.]